MRKLRVMSILFFLVSAALFALFVTYDVKTQDTKPPRIECATDEIITSVDVTEEELLADVTAIDDKSGDISDKVVVESISVFIEDHTRIIKYAVIDDKGNVARTERKLTYEDYQEPRFSLSSSMRFPMGKPVELMEAVSASSVLDGDLTNNIKYLLEKVIDNTKTGIYDVEFRVTDTAGKVSYLPITIELYDKSLESIEVYLKEYLVYIPKGKAFIPTKYYDGANVENGLLAVQSNVDTNKPGVYTVDYTVQIDNRIGKNRLVVIVTE